MKRLVVLLFGLVGAALFMSAANSGDRVLRDSIFHVYRSMPADTTRTVFAKEAAMGHVKESWALELLDSALVFAREIKDVESWNSNTGFFVTIRSGWTVRIWKRRVPP